MIVNKIFVENYGSIKSATFHPQKGLIGIFGESSDNAEKSNGAGKSTLVEAILFGLFGRSQKGTISELKADFSTTPLIVDIEFYLLNRQFRIRRTWDKKAGGFLQLWEDDKEFAGAIKEVQEKINKLLGVSYPVLTAISFFLQGDNDSFSGAASSERLSYMREILSLTFWDNCYDVVLKKKTSANLLQITAVVDSTKQILSVKRASFSLDDLETSQKTVRNIKNTQIQLKERQENLRREREVASENLVQKTFLKEKLDTLIDSLDSLIFLERDFENKLPVESSVKAYRSVESFIQKNRKEIDKQNLYLGEITSDIKRENSFLSMSPEAGVICPTCRQEVKASDIEIHIKEAEKKVVDLTKEAGQIKKYVEGLSYDIGTYENFIFLNKKSVEYLTSRLSYMKEMEELELTKEKIVTTELLIEDINSQLEGIEDSSQLIESLDSQLLELEQDMGKNEVSLRGISDKVVELKLIEKQIDELDIELSKKEDELKTTTEQVSTLELLQRLFGKTGVSFYIVKKVVKSFLEKNCNQILEKLSPYRVEFNLKTSTDKNTLDILIRRNDGMRKYETFSGGEKELLNFAIRMSLSQLLKKRGTGAAIKFVVLDEIFGYLDNYNKGVLENVLMMLRKEFSQLFVISHIPLDLSFDQTVTIKKVGSYSIIE